MTTVIGVRYQMLWLLTESYNPLQDLQSWRWSLCFPGMWMFLWSSVLPNLPKWLLEHPQIFLRRAGGWYSNSIFIINSQGTSDGSCDKRVHNLLHIAGVTDELNRQHTDDHAYISLALVQALNLDSFPSVLIHMYTPLVRLLDMISQATVRYRVNNVGAQDASLLHSVRDVKKITDVCSD